MDLIDLIEFASLAAVAQEKKNQRETLRKQHDDYMRRAAALKRELVILKEQKGELYIGNEPPSPTTNGFLKENDRLQVRPTTCFFFVFDEFIIVYKNEIRAIFGLCFLEVTVNWVKKKERKKNMKQYTMSNDCKRFSSNRWKLFNFQIWRKQRYCMRFFFLVCCFIVVRRTTNNKTKKKKENKMNKKNGCPMFLFRFAFCWQLIWNDNDLPSFCCCFYFFVIFEFILWEVLDIDMLIM